MGKEVVVQLAWSPERGAVPRRVEPKKNATVPVGVPAAGDVMPSVAVNVTLCPDTEGLLEEATWVVVSPRVTA
jgi:hypothetical protein